MDDNTAKMEAFTHDQKRFFEGENRERIAMKIAFDFFEELEAHGVISVEDP